jgi:YD repeat-containing protein
VAESQTNGFVSTLVDGNHTYWISPQFSSQYAYDDDGRVTVITGQGAGSPGAAYTYNNTSEQINRLTKAQISYSASNDNFDYTFNYAYDARGNLQAMDILNGSIVQQQTFTYNDDNQITTSGFTYDNSGNLTAAVIKGTAYHYVYDKGNRLQYVLTGGFSLISRYTYNSQERRLNKELADGTG